VTTPIRSTPPRRKRPRSVHLFALAVLYLGVTNLVRARLALDGQSFAQTLPLTMPLTYLGTCGWVWGLEFVVTAFGVWRLWSWARKLLLVSIMAYQFHIWTNHLMFDMSAYSRLVWPFQIGISVAWIVVVWGFLFLPGIRRVFVKREM
jgi:hypothetical protein